MELNVKKIEECVKHYVTEMNDDHGYYEYTEAIVDIACEAGYIFSDLWNDDGDDSELLSIIDKALYRISVDANKYYMFD